MRFEPLFWVDCIRKDNAKFSCMAGDNPSGSTDTGSRKRTWHYTCNSLIAEGELMISEWNSEGKVAHYHLKCFAINLQNEFVNAGSTLSGYDKLTTKNQERVMMLLPTVDEAVPPKKSKVMPSDTPESEDPEMAPNLIDVAQLPLPTTPVKIYDREINLTTDDFALLSTKYYYIDNTIIIHQIVNNIESSILITAPRHWGKSTVISTLKYFLQTFTHDSEVEFNSDVLSGKPVATNRELFENLQVGGTASMKELGQHPVIHLNLAIAPDSKQEAIKLYQLAIHNCYKEHEYLLKSTVIRSERLNYFRMWCYKRETTTIGDISIAITDLANLLYLHWGKRQCYVLIDEYDAAAMYCLWTESQSYEQCTGVLSPIAAIFQSLKSTIKSIAKIIRTGVSCVTQLWSVQLNNVTKYRFLGKHPYSSLYGVTDDDVKEMLRLRGLSGLLPYVRNYYKGYTTLSGQSMYSTWSILNFLKNEQFNGYWCSTGSIFLAEELFYNLLKRRAMYQLMDSQSIPVQVMDCLSIYHIREIKKFLDDKCRYVSHDGIFSLLFDQGCLTYTGSSDMLELPNEELKDHFRELLNLYFYKTLDFYEAERRELCEAFDKVFQFIHSAQDLPSAMKKYMEKMNALLIALRKVGEDMNEAAIRIIFCRGTERITSTVHVEQQIRDGGKLVEEKNAVYCSTLGSGDAQMGMLVQFKVNASAKKATEQIIEKGYMKAFKIEKELKNPSQVFVMGLSFYKDKSKWESRYTIYERENENFADGGEKLKDSKWIDVEYP